MAEKKTAGRPGRKAPEGEKKQFLTSMDPEIIRRIKAAAALRDKTASLVLEEAAKDWLDRNDGTKGQGKRG
jgi:predicted transcriptional regulator